VQQKLAKLLSFVVNRCGFGDRKSAGWAWVGMLCRAGAGKISPTPAGRV